MAASTVGEDPLSDKPHKPPGLVLETCGPAGGHAAESACRGGGDGNAVGGSVTTMINVSFEDQGIAPRAPS